MWWHPESSPSKQWCTSTSGPCAHQPSRALLALSETKDSPLMPTMNVLLLLLRGGGSIDWRSFGTKCSATVKDVILMLACCHC